MGKTDLSKNNDNNLKRYERAVVLKRMLLIKLKFKGLNTFII
jgi:hypothetical protein